MIANKKEFTGGLGLLAAFFVVLFFLFQPLFNGQNAMAYLDALYNSISKGSVYYIPGIQEKSKQFNDKTVEMSLKYGSVIEAKQAATLFSTAGATVKAEGETLSVSGSLGGILSSSLADADLMYHNDGKSITDKYDMAPRRAVYNWWSSLKLMDKALKDQGEFEAAKITLSVQKKAVEAAYNYFEIEPLKIMDKLGMVIFSLAFYVFYTLWYGFAILFIFEGWGLRLSH